MSELVRVPGTTFVMGSDHFYRDEAPAHRRSVESFWIDRAPVTNTEYGEFVAETGYTTVAERPVPLPDGSQKDPGSLVFVPTQGPVDLSDWRQWWSWTPGARAC